VDNTSEESVIEDDREMFADSIIGMGECRVCGCSMYVFDDNDICIGCSEEIPN
jgi:hypothetical protein